MNYYNKRLNLTAEPAKLNPNNYCVEIDGELRIIHKSLIEGSADWEKQPDWQITAFVDNNYKYIWYLSPSDQNYHYATNHYDLHAMLHTWPCVDSGHLSILSVRRSDGVEFKVGDDCGKSHMGYDKIIKFEIADDIMIAHFDHMPRIELSELLHAPEDNFLDEHIEKYSLADIRKAWDKGYSKWFEVDNFIEQLKQVK